MTLGRPRCGLILALLAAAIAGWVVAARGAEACWTANVVSVDRVIDADTVVFELGIWPKVVITETVRLLGVDAPERADLPRWKAARDFTVSWLADNGLSVVVCRYDSFGRALGRIVSKAKGDLSAALIAAGHGVVYERR
jgi:endonuclease YncB( thermonuclease family)